VVLAGRSVWTSPHDLSYVCFVFDFWPEVCVFGENRDCDLYFAIIVFQFILCMVLYVVLLKGIQRVLKFILKVSIFNRVFY
jgi:hypothetical protein